MSKYSSGKINNFLGLPSRLEAGEFYLIEDGTTTEFYFCDTKGNLIPLHNAPALVEGNGIDITGGVVSIDTGVTVDKTTVQSLINKTITGTFIGNASTATSLQTARLINGVSFDGTADIIVPPGAGTKAVFNTALTDGDFVFTSDIGSSVQAYDTDLTALATLNGTGFARQAGSGSWSIVGETGTGSVVRAIAPALSGAVTNTGTYTNFGNGLLSTSADGIILSNTGSPAAGTAFWSPRLRWQGTGYSTFSMAVQDVEMYTELQVTSGFLVSNKLVTKAQVGGGGFFPAMELYADGYATFYGVVTATGFVGPLTGSATSAATLTTPRTIGGVSFDGSANITVASATGGFTVSGGNLALGANSLTMTGSIGATGSRVTKGWFTDAEFTNAPTVGGISATGLGGLVREYSPLFTSAPRIVGSNTPNTSSDGFVFDEGISASSSTLFSRSSRIKFRTSGWLGFSGIASGADYGIEARGGFETSSLVVNLISGVYAGTGGTDLLTLTEDGQLVLAGEGAGFSTRDRITPTDYSTFYRAGGNTHFYDATSGIGNITASWNSSRDWTFYGAVTIYKPNVDYYGLTLQSSVGTNAAGMRFLSTGQTFVGRDTSTSSHVTGSGNPYDSYLWAESYTDIHLGTNNTSRVKIDRDGIITATQQIKSNDTSGVFLWNIPAGTGPRSIRLGNSGNNVYFGTEGSTAGGFFTGSLAYGTVIYSDNSIQQIIGGVARVTTLVNGAVGIGTATPSQKLDVNGAIALSGIRLAETSGAYNVLFSQANNGAIYLGGSGDPANYYDNTNHHFRSAGGTMYGTWGSDGINLFGAFASLRLAGSHGGAKAYYIEDYISGVSNTGLSIRNVTDGVIPFVIDTNNLVGINETAPNARLTVTQPDGGNYLSLFKGTSKAIRFIAGSSQVSIDATDYTGSVSYQPLAFGGSTLTFQTGGSTRLSIDGTAVSFTVPIIASSITVPFAPPFLFGLTLIDNPSSQLGFWGTTPVSQPAAGGASATFVANSGTAVNDASTFDGYTIKQVVKALRQMGLLG